MSDQFYAVQFRSMQTGHHNIAVFSLEKEAQWFFDLIDTLEEIPEDYQYPPDSFIGIKPIDFRNKPYEAFEMEILYINEWDKNKDNIPDVYNH